MIYFTSDPHYYHKNIIAFCGRKAADVDDMNQQLIDNWNAVITDNDEVYLLGDFAFCGKQRRLELIMQLLGKKHLIRGNHDPDPDRWWLEAGFYSVQDYKELRVQDMYQNDDGGNKSYHQHIVLMHFPILSWNGMAHGSWHLHGHCHGNMANKGLRMDVGVDTNNLKPYSYEDIKNYMALQTVTPTKDSLHVPTRT